jgi:hypothetical protein
MSTYILPTYVPYLDWKGTNWITFSTHFHEAMQANGYWGYLDGTCVHPIPKDVNMPTKVESEEDEAWEHEDSVAFCLLLQGLLDSTAL